MKTLMAVDRYRALSRNYRPSSRKGPPKIAHAIAGLVWLCAFSFSMPVFMRATIIGDGEATHCFEQWDDYQYLGLDDLQQGPRTPRIFLKTERPRPFSIPSLRRSCETLILRGPFRRWGGKPLRQRGLILSSIYYLGH